MEFRPLRLLRESLLSNHHNLQFVESNHLHLLHRLERIAVDSDFFDVGEPAQIQLQQAMASLVGEMEFRDGGGQSGQLVSIVDYHKRRGLERGVLCQRANVWLSLSLRSPTVFRQTGEGLESQRK